MSDSEKFKTFEVLVSSYEVNQTNEDALKITMEDASSVVRKVSQPIETDGDKKFSDAEGSAKAASEINKELIEINENEPSITDAPDLPQDSPVDEGNVSTQIKVDQKVGLKKKLYRKLMNYLEGDNGVMQRGVRIMIELWKEDGEQMDGREGEEDEE